MILGVFQLVVASAPRFPLTGFPLPRRFIRDVLARSLQPHESSLACDRTSDPTSTAVGQLTFLIHHKCERRAAPSADGDGRDFASCLRDIAPDKSPSVRIDRSRLDLLADAAEVNRNYPDGAEETIVERHAVMPFAVTSSSLV